MYKSQTDKKEFFKELFIFVAIILTLYEEKSFCSSIYVLNGTKFERPIRIVSPAVPSRYFSIVIKLFIHVPRVLFASIFTIRVMI